MSILASILFTKTTATAVAVATITGLSCIYYQRDKIIPYLSIFSDSKTSKEERYMSDAPFKVADSHISERQAPKLVDTLLLPVIEDRTTPIIDNLLDGSEFDYVVAQFTKNESDTNADKKLFDATNVHQEYICEFENEEALQFISKACKIFKSGSSDNQNGVLIDLSTPSKGAEIKDKANLKTNTHYVVQLPKNFLKQFGYSNKYPLKILHKDDQDYSFGVFDKFIGVDKETQQLKANAVKSNLFIAEVVKDTTDNGALDYSLEYKCKIGRSERIPCKLYSVEKGPQEINKSELDRVAKITDVAESLKDGKYIIVDLIDANKSISQLEGQLEIFKVTGDTQTTLVTAVADQLVVGSLSEEPNSSSLFFAKDDYGKLTDGSEGNVANQKSYLVTKTQSINAHLKKTSYQSNDYICRVINKKEKFDDENCKLFPFFISSKDSFELSDYKADSSKINSFVDLEEGKYQVIELKKILKDKLVEPDSSFHLVRKSRKDRSINNKVFELTKEHVLHDEITQGDTSLKTNLFLVRYKSRRPDKEIIISDTDSLTCDIVGTTTSSAQNCKIYKFTPSFKGNVITKEQIKGLELVSSTNLMVYPYHYVIELDQDNMKSFEEMKNNTFTVKKGDDTLGLFEFDSLIFGLPKVAGLQEPRQEVAFIVEKEHPTTPWSTLTNTISYRCKFPAPITSIRDQASSKPQIIDNFDFNCKLVKIPINQNKHIQTLSTIKGLTEKIEHSSLTGQDDPHFKLVFDKKALYNFPEDISTSEKNIEILLEVLSDTMPKDKGLPPTKHVKKLRIKQQIDPAKTTLAGNATYVLAEIEENPTDINEPFVLPKCSYFTTTTDRFDCDMHPIDATPPNAGITSTTDLAKFSLKATKSDAFNTKEVFLIKLDGDKKISELITDKYVYHYAKSTEDFTPTQTESTAPTSSSTSSTSSTSKPQPKQTPTQKKTKQIKLTIKGFAEGIAKDCKQLFFIQDPVAPTKP